MHGAEIFCPIRSYLATTAHHGSSWLDALTRAASGTPWIPQNQINQPGTKAPPTKAITGTYLVTSELRPIRRSASACLLNSVVVVDPVLPIIGRRSASSYALCRWWQWGQLMTKKPRPGRPAARTPGALGRPEEKPVPARSSSTARSTISTSVTVGSSRLRCSASICTGSPRQSDLSSAWSLSTVAGCACRPTSPATRPA